jgi:autotransporter-associated beta strand protein
MTISGLISGGGSLTIGTSTLTGTGAGTANPTAIVGDGKVALTGDNTYSGGTKVNFGTAIVSGINSLGGANYGGLTLTNGGSVQFASTLTSSSDLTTGTGVTLGTGGGGFDTNENNVIFANGLRGPGGLTKSGLGTLTLNAASTYAGGTVVNGGTLRIAAPTGSATGSGTITVNSGATFTGSGSVAGAMTVNTGGILEPGNGVGTLSLPGLTLAAQFGAEVRIQFHPGERFHSGYRYERPDHRRRKRQRVSGRSGSPFATAGTYNLFSFNGGIQGTGVGAFSVVNPAAGFLYTFGTNSNFITLTVATSGLVSNWANAQAAVGTRLRTGATCAQRDWRDGDLRQCADYDRHRNARRQQDHRQRDV